MTMLLQCQEWTHQACFKQIVNNRNYSQRWGDRENLGPVFISGHYQPKILVHAPVPGPKPFCFVPQPRNH